MKRKIKESLEMKEHNNNLNRDEGIELSDNWKPIINIIKITKSTSLIDP